MGNDRECKNVHWLVIHMVSMETEGQRHCQPPPNKSSKGNSQLHDVMYASLFLLWCPQAFTCFGPKGICNFSVKAKRKTSHNLAILILPDSGRIL